MSEQLSGENDTELFNLQNTKNGRCAVFFGNTEDDAIDTASEFWGTTPANIKETEI
jgi:hypothetical protein